MLIYDLITSSLRKLGVVASGETPSNSELNDALLALQVMLRSWAAERINVFCSTTETVVLSGTTTFAWGTGGTIDSLRPNQLLEAIVNTSSGTVLLCKLLSEHEFSQATTVNLSAYLEPAYPLALLYLFNLPNDAVSLTLKSVKPFTESSSFSSVLETLALPLYYEEALIYSLAVRLAPEYGKSVSAEVISMTNNAYSRLITLNAAKQVEPAVVILPID